MRDYREQWLGRATIHGKVEREGTNLGRIGCGCLGPDSESARNVRMFDANSLQPPTPTTHTPFCNPGNDTVVLAQERRKGASDHAGKRKPSNILYRPRLRLTYLPAELTSAGIAIPLELRPHLSMSIALARPHLVRAQRAALIHRMPMCLRGLILRTRAATTPVAHLPSAFNPNTLVLISGLLYP
jgi:hypothetical protein